MKLLKCLIVLLIVACDNKAEQTEEQPPADSTVAADAWPAVDSGAIKLQPIDQANESFRTFRAQLLTALARQDTSFVLGILAPEIKNSFGGDDSISGFKRMWNLNEPNSKLWSTLTRVLQMGGKLEADTAFTAPYVFAFWPDSVDAFEYVAVTSREAKVYERADSTSKVIGTASYSLLKREYTGDETWSKLTLPDKRTAFMRNTDVYSPVDYRAFFERRNARWVILTFVAGD